MSIRAKRRRPSGIRGHPYYRSRAWYGRRHQVRARAGGLCEFCRVRGIEHVHHRTYRHFGQEPLGDLMACCRDCHAAIHGRRHAGTPLSCAAGSLLALGDSGRGPSALWTRYLRTVKGGSR